MFLTGDEVEALTGCKRGQDQCDWLVSNGYRFNRRRDGLPAVLRAHVNERLMDKPGAADMVTGPDWDAMGLGGGSEA